MFVAKLDDVIDLVIPRGSNKLVSQIKASTKIPVLGHAGKIYILLLFTIFINYCSYWSFSHPHTGQLWCVFLSRWNLSCIRR